MALADRPSPALSTRYNAVLTDNGKSAQADNACAMWHVCPTDHSRSSHSVTQNNCEKLDLAQTRTIAIRTLRAPTPSASQGHAKARSGTPLRRGAQQRGRQREARAIRPTIRKALAASLLAKNNGDTNGAR